MTAGATTANGGVANYSDTGICVDIWAPGGDSTRMVATCDGGGQGTSFSSPELAGAAVLIFSANPTWTPATVEWQIKHDAVTQFQLLTLHIPDDSCYTYNICNTTVCATQ